MFWLLPRKCFCFVHDISVACISLPVALLLRVGSDNLPDYYGELAYAVPTFTLIATALFWQCRMYRALWRYTSVADLQAILIGSLSAILLFLPTMFVIDRLQSIPRSVPVIQLFCLVVILGGSRLIRRIFAERRGKQKSMRSDHPQRQVPILLIGGGEGATLLMRTLENSVNAAYRIIGIVDSSADEKNVGRRIRNVPILGNLDQLEALLSDLNRKGQYPERIVLTSRLESNQMQMVKNEAIQARLPLSQIPSLTEFRIASAKNRIIEVLPVAPEDLLGRPQVVLDDVAIDRMIAGCQVLITGAGGSIGSELARQIARRRPAQIILLDACEYNLYAIDHEIGSNHPHLTRQALLVNIRDAETINRVFSEHRPELVFHAAALKHVPLVELNPIEGVRTNVLGTRNVADAACAFGARAFVQVSTDKAVNPTSAMGATKRWAELYCQALDLACRGVKPVSSADLGHNGARFMTVRFGNVLGSSGSIIPLFRRQLEKGGPITVTHPEITRYFMLVSEAVGLVLHSSAFGTRSEEHRGHIFVLDMGQPIRVLDIAKQMIRLAGMEPHRDVGIKFIGLRPGEKLFEELFDKREKRSPISVDGVFMAEPGGIELPRLKTALSLLEATCMSNNEGAVRTHLWRFPPGPGG